MDAEVYANMATTQYTRLTYVVPYVQHDPGYTATAESNDNVIHMSGDTAIPITFV